MPINYPFKILILIALLPVIAGMEAAAQTRAGSEEASEPSPLPWHESFSRQVLKGDLYVETSDNSVCWQLYGDRSFSGGVKSQDEDDGMLGLSSIGASDSGRLTTGWIDLSGSIRPILTFHTFNLKLESLRQDSDSLCNNLAILVDKGEGFERVMPLLSRDVTDEYEVWERYSVDLTAYRDESVRIAFEITTCGYAYSLLDNISLKDCRIHDLVLSEFHAPAKVFPGIGFEFLVDVENRGTDPVDNFGLKLMKNGEIISVICGETLGAHSSGRYVLHHTLGIQDEEANEFQVEIFSELDEDVTDNCSRQMTVRKIKAPYPTVTNPEASVLGQGILVSWAEPEAIEETYVPVTEGFEEVETSDLFPTEFGDWTFLDLDGGRAGGFKEMEFPGIVPGTRQSFWVNDSSHEAFGGNMSIFANSGNKCLAQIYSMNEECTEAIENDDWAISPPLSEEAQTISFFARSYGNGETAERFEFLISKTDMKPTSFSRIGEVRRVPNLWTPYSFEVPEGTRYFAVRCISEFAFMLMLDDFRYIPANGRNIQLQGYNIYINGQQVNEDGPVEDLSFYAEIEVEFNKEIQIGVSAVYSHGESDPASIILVNTGMQQTDVETTVAVEGRKIIAKANEPAAFTLFSTDGRIIFAGTAEGTLELPVSTGIYVARLADQTIKLIVR